MNVGLCRYTSPAVDAGSAHPCQPVIQQVTQLRTWSHFVWHCLDCLVHILIKQQVVFRLLCPHSHWLVAYCCGSMLISISQVTLHPAWMVLG